MYNEKIKLEYLDYKKKSREPLKEIMEMFRDSAPYEEALEKDLCDMDTEELLGFLMKYNSVKHVVVKRRKLSNYIEWCMIKGYSGYNWISTKVVDVASLKEIYLKAREEFYISREMYETYKNMLLESNYGVYMASAFCATYEGIAGQGFYNLACLRARDINVETNTVKLGEGWEVQISEELTKMLLDTSKVTEITNENTVKYASSLYPDSIWKIRKNDNVTIATIKRKLVFLINECKEVLKEEKITKTALERSGYFNDMYFRLLDQGIDAKKIKLGVDKQGREENRSYDKYFENSKYDNMDMRKFIDSFQSYLNQV